MSKLDYDEAEVLGITLTEDQHRITEYDARYVLVPQVIPQPDCEGSSYSAYCCSRPVDYGTEPHRHKRVIVPTVAELLTRDVAAQIAESDWDSGALPAVYGHPLNLEVVAGSTECGVPMDCGCIETGDLACDCYGEQDIEAFLPYSAVPLTYSQALGWIAAISSGMPQTVLPALGDRHWLECHTLDAAECEGWDISINRTTGEWELSPDAQAELAGRLEFNDEWLAERGAVGSDRLHIPEHGYRYTMTEEQLDQEARMMRRLAHTLRSIKDVLARDTRAVRTDSERAFVYPTLM